MIAGVNVVFIPQRIYFEKEALDYPLGEALFARFKGEGQEIRFATSHNRITGLPGDSPAERFQEAKKTLVVGVRKTLDFSGCKPSAHYQLPLTTGCPGRCHYCYLHSTLGPRPYLRIYVNMDDILSRTREYILQRSPEITVFEGSATSDPLAVEHFSGALKQTISFFAGQERGRFRFATKQVEVDSLLSVEHGGRTRVRFRVNASQPARRYDKGVPSVGRRIEAGIKMARSGFPTGFLVAPVFIYEGWKQDYLTLLERIGRAWEKAGPLNEQTSRELPPPTFEIIAHRFTPKARERILSITPESDLPMDKKDRTYRYGQFGYGKYVYPKDTYREIEDLFRPAIQRLFPQGSVDYVV